MSAIKFAFLLTTLLSTTKTSSPSLLQPYGHHCDPTGIKKALQCDGNLGLTCNKHNMCKCKMLENAEGIHNIPVVYSKHACRVRANGTCSFTKEGAVTVYECLRNAQCENSTCVCIDGYNDNADGTHCVSQSSGIHGFLVLVFTALILTI